MKTSVPLPESCLIFLGSGPSTGIPTPSCLWATDQYCRVCHSAVSNRPTDCRNRRGNPSLLIRIDDGKHIQIDCGKTFRDAVINIFPLHGIQHIDALLITHSHADAILGLDDIRGIQKQNTNLTQDLRSIDTPACTPLPVFCSGITMRAISQKFDYLCPDFKQNLDCVRSVASLNWNVIQGDSESPTEPFEALPGFFITPLPVEHGNDCICLGFLFGRKEKVAYLSDISRLTEATRIVLEANAPLDLLIVDALFKTKRHNTHFNLIEALECVRILKPKRTLLTGLTHEFDHDVDNAKLAMLKETEGIDVQLAYDGLLVMINL